LAKRFFKSASVQTPVVMAEFGKVFNTERTKSLEVKDRKNASLTLILLVKHNKTKKPPKADAVAFQV
jgi:pantothenate kinase